MILLLRVHYSVRCSSRRIVQCHVLGQAIYTIVYSSTVHHRTNTTGTSQRKRIQRYQEYNSSLLHMESFPAVHISQLHRGIKVQLHIRMHSTIIELECLCAALSVWHSVSILQWQVQHGSAMESVVLYKILGFQISLGDV